MPEDRIKQIKFHCVCYLLINRNRHLIMIYLLQGFARIPCRKAYMHNIKDKHNKVQSQSPDLGWIEKVWQIGFGISVMSSGGWGQIQIVAKNCKKSRKIHNHMMRIKEYFFRVLVAWLSTCHSKMVTMANPFLLHFPSSVLENITIQPAW